MSFSLGTDVRCSNIKLNELEAQGSTGTAGQVLKADGTGRCVWGGAPVGGVSNPLSADLLTGGFDIIGNGLIKNDGLELNNTGNDNLPVSNIYKGSLYKLRLNTGSVNQLAFQNNFKNTATGFPTNAENVNFCNGMPVFGPTCIGKIEPVAVNTGNSVEGRVGFIDVADDVAYLDPCNCRGGVVSNDYKDFAITNNLPGCSGAVGTSAKGILKVDVVFSVDFANTNNNEVNIFLKQYRSMNFTTGSRGTLFDTRDIFKDKTDIDDYRHSASFYFRGYDGQIQIGDSFCIEIEIPTGSAHNATNVEADYYYYWSPTP